MVMEFDVTVIAFFASLTLFHDAERIHILPREYDLALRTGSRVQ